MKSLDAYLRRIGVSATLKADFATLSLIMEAQSRSIAFENYDVVMGKTINMSPAEVEEKLVSRGRGGYCWELNTLLRSALEEIGYDVVPLMCRVRWNKPDDTAEPNTTFTHMALRVTTEAGVMLADVGFAGTNSMAPVKLGTDEPQTMPEGQFRIVDSTHPRYSVLQLLIKGEWKPLYEFVANEKAPQVDMECANWFSCTFPAARFTTSFFTCRVIGDERHHILNGDYVCRKGHGAESEVVSRAVSDKAELLELISTVFGIQLDETEGIDRYLPNK